MNPIFYLLSLLTILLSSCSSNNNAFVVGNWTINNLSSVDSSANKETLLNTFLLHNFSDTNILEFSADNSLVMKSENGQVLGKGTYKIEESGNTIIVKFPLDNIESRYKITNKTDISINMTANDNGETATILLTKTGK